VLDGLRARPDEGSALPVGPLAVEQVAVALQQSPGARRGRPPGAARA